MKRVFDAQQPVVSVYVRSNQARLIILRWCRTGRICADVEQLPAGLEVVEKDVSSGRKFNFVQAPMPWSLMWSLIAQALLHNVGRGGLSP